MPANTSQLRPKVKRMMNAFLTEALKNGIRLLVTQGVRTIEEQDELYKKGRRGVKGEKIVTQAKGGQSEHNFGVCFDIVGFDGKRISYSINWKKLGDIWKKMGGTWGGDWKSFPDKPHFSYTLGYSIKDFQNGKVDWKKFT